MTKDEAAKLAELVSAVHQAAVEMDKAAWSTSRELTINAYGDSYTEAASQQMRDAYNAVCEVYWKAYQELDQYVHQANLKRIMRR
jgi:uncharacterized protein (DUF305 family)